MNKTFRTIWNQTRGCFVVAHEKTATRGKSGSKSTVIAAAVASALSALAVNPVSAADLCVGVQTSVVNVTATNSCVVTSGESVIVTTTDALRVSGVLAAEGVTNAGTISGSDDGIDISADATFNLTNSGLIQGNTAFGAGIYIQSDDMTGSITNLSGGVIQGDNGIEVYETATINGSVINAGTIKGFSGAGIFVTSDSILGGITNSGMIQGGYGIRLTDGSSVTGGIYNEGTISGTFRSVSVDGSSSLSGITIAGNNTAKFIGEVFAEDTPVTVASGATYTMDDGQLFTLTNSSFTNAGTLKVGANNTVSGDVGTITGNFINTGTFSTTVESTTVAGRLNVSGNASLTGSTIAVDVKTVNTLAIGETIAGVISAGTLTGNFATVKDNSALFNFASIVNGNDIDLAVLKGLTNVQAVTTSGNNPALGAATALDSIIDSGTISGEMQEIIDRLGSFETEREVSNAVSQTLPLQTGGMSQSIRNSLRGSNRIIQARQEGQHGRSSGDEFFGDQHAWFKPFGSWTNQDNRNGVTGFDANTYGMVFGADAEISDTKRLGVAFSYARSNIDSNSNVAKQTADVNSYQLALYGSHNFSDVTDINFQFDIGKHDNEGLRDITFAGTRAKSDYSSWSAHLGAGLAHTYTLSDKTTLTPSVRADYTRIRDESYNERGAGALNLRVNSNTTEELVLGVDGKLAHALTDKATFTANLGLGYDIINEQASLTSAFAGAPSVSFTTQGLDPSPWLMRGGLGVVSKATETVEISARYDIEARKDFDNQTASVKVRWAF